MPVRRQWLETSLISCSVLLPPWSGCRKRGPLCQISPRISLPQLQGDRTQDGGEGQELAGTKGWVWLYERWEVKLPLSSIVL